jgi:hypothetical protein
MNFFLKKNVSCRQIYRRNKLTEPPIRKRPFYCRYTNVCQSHDINQSQHIITVGDYIYVLAAIFL